MNWQETITEKRRIEAIIKERSHIYQIDEKEWAAKYFDMPIDSFYHTPYYEWQHIRKRASSFLEIMRSHCYEVEKSSGLYLYDKPLSSWLTLYKVWLQIQYKATLSNQEDTAS